MNQRRNRTEEQQRLSSKVCESTQTEDAVGPSAVRALHMWAVPTGVTTH